MRIFINASTSVGDSLYFSFILDNLYRKYPDASIQVACWHPMVDFYKSYPFIEQVIPFDLIAKDMKFSMFLLYPKIDIFIDLQHTKPSAQMCKAANVKLRIGVNPDRESFGCYDYVIVPKEGESIYDSFYRGFKELWPDFDLDGRFFIRIGEKERLEGASILLENNIPLDKPYVIIHPGAKGFAKLWRNDHWAVVADYLHSKGTSVILIGSSLVGWGGDDITDVRNCREIEEMVPHAVFNLCGKTKNFMVLGAVIKGASFYCGLDTGPTHFAAILQVPVFEIYKYYTDSRYKLWKPWGENVFVLKSGDLENLAARDYISLLEEYDAFKYAKTTFNYFKLKKVDAGYEYLR